MLGDAGRLMSKWFDAKDKPAELVLPLRSTGGATWHDAKVFCRELAELFRQRRLPEDTYKLFTKLCDTPPAARLTRNLKVVLSILAQRPIQSILVDGLTEGERFGLLDLEHASATATAKATAQGLLNVEQRRQLAVAAGAIYQAERTRCWQE